MALLFVRDVPDRAEGAAVFQIKTFLLVKRRRVEKAGTTREDRVRQASQRRTKEASDSEK